MKYAILIYGSEDMEPADDAVMQEYFALSERETTVDGAELDYPSTATTVRVQNGDVLTTDGPFAETKEVLGGLYLIDVPNLDDAIEFAAAVPAAKRGGSENWAEIAGLYAELHRITRSPVVELNRAVDLDGYRYFHSTRGELLRQLERSRESRAAYQRALDLTPDGPEQRFLERRIAGA